MPLERSKMNDLLERMGSYMFKEDWEKVPEAQHMKLEALLRTAAMAVDEIRHAPMQDLDKKQVIAALIEQAAVCRYVVSPPEAKVKIELVEVRCLECGEKPMQGKLSFEEPE